MKYHLLTGFFLLLVVPGLLLGQSLTELAKQEKERRKKNKESGKEVQVITDRELAATQGRIANPEGSVTAGGSTSYGTDDVEYDDDGVDDEAVTEIPADAPLDQKLNLLERMKTSYQEQVREIDAEIEKNNQRLAQIEDELVSTGGTGLPTAPQADLTPRNPGNIPGLRSEQQVLRQRNQALEAQKQSTKNDIIAKARRAGIPPGYLNF